MTRIDAAHMNGDFAHHGRFLQVDSPWRLAYQKNDQRIWKVRVKRSGILAYSSVDKKTRIEVLQSLIPERTQLTQDDITAKHIRRVRDK
jgi:hypothetical protein